MFFFLDSAKAWQVNFQDPATPIMEGVIDFHNHILFFLIIIACLVGWLLFRVCQLFGSEKLKEPLPNFSHSTLLEVAWTVFPALILVAIAIPSFALLYSLEEVIDPFFTLKVTGAQWYWHYEYSDWLFDNDIEEDLNFDSYLLPEASLNKGQFRLLEVDNRILLPIYTHIRVLVTAQDVLHSWSIPAFGVKIDACPGRLNQVSLFIKRAGTYYGQCQELCGVNHALMPIVVEAVSLADYIEWICAKLALAE